MMILSLGMFDFFDCISVGAGVIRLLLFLDCGAINKLPVRLFNSDPFKFFTRRKLFGVDARFLCNVPILVLIFVPVL